MLHTLCSSFLFPIIQTLWIYPLYGTNESKNGKVNLKRGWKGPNFWKKWIWGFFWMSFGTQLKISWSQIFWSQIESGSCKCYGTFFLVAFIFLFIKSSPRNLLINLFLLNSCHWSEIPLDDVQKEEDMAPRKMLKHWSPKMFKKYHWFWGLIF